MEFSAEQSYAFPRDCWTIFVLGFRFAGWNMPSLGAGSIAVEAYLRLAGIPFTVEVCQSERSSPTGQLPCIEVSLAPLETIAKQAVDAMGHVEHVVVSSCVRNHSAISVVPPAVRRHARGPPVAASPVRQRYKHDAL